MRVQIQQRQEDEYKSNSEEQRQCSPNGGRKTGEGGRRVDRVGTCEDILISPEKDSWKIPRSFKEIIEDMRTLIASVHSKAIAEEEEGALILR
jgi:hypothetical protein